MYLNDMSGMVSRRCFKRWIVKKTFAWLSPLRRRGKDYGLAWPSAEAFVKTACIRRMIKLSE